MNVSRKITRPLAVVTATVAATAAFTVPALANAGVDLSSAIDYSTPSRQVLVSVQIVMGTRNLDLQTRNVAGICEAVSIGDAASTRLTQCALYVNGVRVVNAPRALPGPGVVSAVASQVVPLGASVSACATGSALWTDGSISPSRGGCTAAQISLA